MIKKILNLKKITENLLCNIYVNTAPSQEISILHAMYLTNTTIKSTIICDFDSQTLKNTLTQKIFLDLKKKSNKHLIDLFFKKTNQQTNLIRFLHSIEHLKVNKKSQLLLLIPETLLFIKEKSQHENALQKLKKYAASKNVTIHLYIYGQDQILTNKILHQRPDLCMGYRTLKKVDIHTYLQQTYYWGSSTGMQSDNSLYLLNKQQQLSIVKKKMDTSIKFSTNDEDIIYIANTAIEKSQKQTNRMICALNNDELEKNLNELSSASIVFSLHEQDEITNLGIKIYHLRKAFGGNIKIIIREMKQCLRYADEMYLRSSGINLILYKNTSFLNMLSAIDILKGQIFTRQFSISVSDLKGLRSQKNNLKGYVSNDVFIAYTQESIARLDLTRTKFALLKLTFLTNISPQTYLNLCEIKRIGDLVTLCQDTLYLFLQGIHSDDLNTALNKIFTLPTDDIFYCQSRFTSTESISEELMNVSKHPLTIAKKEKPNNDIQIISRPLMRLAQHSPLDF